MAENPNMEYVTVRVHKENAGRVGIHEYDQAHVEEGNPEGELWVGPGQTVRCARTAGVDAAIREKRLEALQGEHAGMSPTEVLTPKSVPAETEAPPSKPYDGPPMVGGPAEAHPDRFGPEGSEPASTPSESEPDGGRRGGRSNK